MKIFILVTQLEAGGAQKAAAKLAEGLGVLGHQVTLLFLYRKTSYQILERHFKIVVLSELKKKSKIITLLKALYYLRKMCITQKPDALVTFTHYANISGAFCKLSGGISKLVVSHRNPYQSYSTPVKRLDRLFSKAGVYDAITHVSRSVRHSFPYLAAEHSSPPQSVIHNAADNSLFSEMHAVPSKKNPYFIAVGRLVAQKNHLLLVEAMRHVPPPYELFLIGEGPLRGEIEKRIFEYALGSRIKLWGEISHQDTINLVKGARAFLMPSLYEGMSNALIEAVVLGVYPIVSNAPAQVEALTSPHGKIFGSILPPDSSIWANTLRNLTVEGHKELLPENIEALGQLKAHYRPERFISDFDSEIKRACT